MPGRRPLRFARLDEVTPDVEGLLRGHVTVGRWSLGQMCNHLALCIRLSMDGFPTTAPWIVRKTVGVAFRQLMFRTGRIAEGVKVPRVYMPTPGLDASSESEALREQIARFRSFAGPLAAHPMFGRMTPEQWERFHCIHCAHHLSFAVPAGAASSDGAVPAFARNRPTSQEPR
jgi:hypothetical protein